MSSVADPVHEPGEEYSGPAELISEDQDVLEVEVQLRGHVEPIDGRFHWYGRIAVDASVTARHRSGTSVVVRTPHGTAAGRLSDVDPWGRFRLTGLGAPPF
ncbi:MAG: DUF4873 domain-containing protein [Marmoricola sp.]